MRFAEQSDYEVLSDRVVAAMETGNPNQARALLAAHAETLADEVLRIRHEILKDYGVQL